MKGVFIVLYGISMFAAGAAFAWSLVGLGVVTP